MNIALKCTGYTDIYCYILIVAHGDSKENIFFLCNDYNFYSSIPPLPQLQLITVKLHFMNKVWEEPVQMIHPVLCRSLRPPLF